MGMAPFKSWLLVLLGVAALSLAVEGSVFIPATDPSIHYVGRYSFSTDQVAGFDWSGFSFSIKICGATRVTLEMQDNLGMYSVRIDGQETQTLHVNPNPDSNIAMPSTDCHILTVTKMTEANNNPQGVSLLSAISTDAPSIEAHRGLKEVKSVTSTTRRLEFIGDGITCGYGVLATSEDCPSPSGYYGKEDVTHSYAGYIANSFQAQSQVECFTGKGVVHNKGDSNVFSDEPMPALWNRTMATISNIYYDFQSFVPDGVYINLGTNDFATQPYPTSSQFISGYKSFISTIRQHYQSVPLFLACGPLASSTTCSYVEQVATDEDATYISFKNLPFNSTDVGCDGFPNSKYQKQMANTSIPIMAKVLGW